MDLALRAIPNPPKIDVERPPEISALEGMVKEVLLRVREMDRRSPASFDVEPVSADANNRILHDIKQLYSQIQEDAEVLKGSVPTTLIARLNAARAWLSRASEALRAGDGRGASRYFQSALEARNQALSEIQQEKNRYVEISDLGNQVQSVMSVDDSTSK
jgi:hypothetical protein